MLCSYQFLPKSAGTIHELVEFWAATVVNPLTDHSTIQQTCPNVPASSFLSETTALITAVQQLFLHSIAQKKQCCTKSIKLLTTLL